MLVSEIFWISSEAVARLDVCVRRWWAMRSVCNTPYKITSNVREFCEWAHLYSIQLYVSKKMNTYAFVCLFSILHVWNYFHWYFLARYFFTWVPNFVYIIKLINMNRFVKKYFNFLRSPHEIHKIHELLFFQMLNSMTLFMKYFVCSQRRKLLRVLV